MPRTKKQSSKSGAGLSSKKLKQLHALVGRIAPIMDIDLLLTEVYHQILVLFATRDAAVVLNDIGEVKGSNLLMRVRRSDGFKSIRLDTGRPGLGQHIAGFDGAAVIDDIFEVDNIPAPPSKRITANMPRCVLGGPLIVDGMCKGIVAAGRINSGCFSAEEQTLMRLFLDHVTIAVQNAFKYRQEKLSSLEWIKVVDALNDGIFVHDSSNKILRANRRFVEMFGKGLGSVTGMDCSKLFSSNGESGCPYCKQKDSLSDNKPELLSAVSSCSIRDESNNIHSVVHVVREGQDEVNGLGNDSLEALGGLISGVAHEVKTPITGIIGYSELALDKVREKNPADEKIMHYLNRIHSEGNRAYRIIHDLLYFSRNHQPETGRVKVTELLTGLFDIEARRLKKHHIKLKKKMLEVPDVWGDPRQIQQVFANVLSNAIQALMLVEGGGVLEVETSAEVESVLITVRDTGPGISPEVRGRIFDPFFGVEGFSDGIGLGLSVAFGIVNAHGGKISVGALGEKGTEVLIRLPVRRDSVDKHAQLQV